MTVIRLDSLSSSSEIHNTEYQGALEDHPQQNHVTPYTLARTSTAHPAEHSEITRWYIKAESQHKDLFEKYKRNKATKNPKHK